MANDQSRSLSVAVVGAGAAGLATTRELLRAGHRPTVFEQAGNIGGVWKYSDEVDDEPCGGGQHTVPGSAYANLRCNLPREVMGLPEFPFDSHFNGSADPRQFCGHEEVQRYLEAFAEAFGLLQHICFNTEVQHLAPAAPSDGGPSSSSSSASKSAASSSSSWQQWDVTTRPTQPQPGGAPGASCTQRFDAVVVCSGHYSQPRVPHFPGQDEFPGLLMHSHNYRRPEPFKGQTVVIVGASSSGIDLADDIASAGAKQVYLCARVWENPLTGQVLQMDDSSILKRRQNGGGNGGDGGPAAAQGCEVTKAPNIQQLHADGSVSLVDGSHITGVDVVLFCTGFSYSFPFLEGTGLVSVQDNRVGPLYQHVFPPSVAPTLSFVGLTWKVVPLPQFRLQSRWIAQVLAGAVELPSRQDMEQHIAEFYASLDASGTPQRYTHRQSDGVQWEYNRWLAEQCGDEPEPAWRQELYKCGGLSRKENAGGYRDQPLPGAQEAQRAAQEEAAWVRKQRATAASTA
ncbi:hypothetical protein D9Q98_000224 [Chlorella vulgaris]|uniref:Flavin-containing monooxygenase n=1 Tax=Chlorella vulgaris TaxID=3077 RepID=A0A9D4TXY0_CHLVU|nr:hypothetical protein D9Q98_000224 [Chlorella vulgaris]